MRPPLPDPSPRGRATETHPAFQTEADRYTKIVLTLIALALILIAVRPWLPVLEPREALVPVSAHAQSLAPRYEVSVPKSWGKYIGFSNNNLLLERSEGMRIVDVAGKSPEYPKVEVLIRWQ